MQQTSMILSGDVWFGATSHEGRSYTSWPLPLGYKSSRTGLGCFEPSVPLMATRTYSLISTLQMSIPIVLWRYRR